jgi:hypothetical protein
MIMMKRILRMMLKRMTLVKMTWEMQIVFQVGTKVMVTGDGDGFDGDKEDNYGYDKHMDDEENSEEEPDVADDALGPEDCEGEGDETYLHHFAVL